MLKNTQIANASLTLNFLPNIQSVEALPKLTRPSKSEILISTLWEVEYFKTALFLDWSHLIRLVVPVEKPLPDGIGFKFCYELSENYRIDKILGFNDMSKWLNFKKYGRSLYTDEKIEVIHIKKSPEPYSFEERSSSFEALLLAYLSFSVGLSVKSKGLEGLGQSVTLAQMGARKAESNNHSSIKAIEMAYLRGSVCQSR